MSLLLEGGKGGNEVQLPSSYEKKVKKVTTPGGSVEGEGDQVKFCLAGGGGEEKFTEGALFYKEILPKKEEII